ncbi:hypothetical protein BDI4_860019 [Burkholderia diffusa]|nr:hypothetical protein BDI4_860019 [Burkholderia diffusa]
MRAPPRSVRAHFAHRARRGGHSVSSVAHRCVGSFPVFASQQNSCCDRAAPAAHAPHVAVTSFRCARIFLGEKCRYEKPTLQLSSYVIDARVFHMMRRRFTLFFVASKALNHLQLSLTIARIC